MAAKGIGGRKMPPGWKDKLPVRRRDGGQREEFTMTDAEHDRLLQSNLRVYDPRYDDTTALVWTDICERLGIEMLTVHHPDLRVPDFTAIRV